MNTIELQRKNAFSAVLTFTDQSQTPPVPYNITGKTIKFTVKKPGDFRDDDNDALITKDWSNHTTPLQGISSLDLTPAQTDIPVGQYKYDFKIDGTCTETGDLTVSRIITTR
jgi:hypothetical protein